MKRMAFTMIELVFVIVVLGILAAIAIPRLTATRDDAVASRMVIEVDQIVKNISADAVAKGVLAANLNSVAGGGSMNGNNVDINASRTLTCARITRASDDVITIDTGLSADIKCGLLNTKYPIDINISILGAAVKRL